MRSVTKTAVTHAVVGAKADRNGRLRLGWTLLKEKQVPFSAKLFALALGGVATLLIIALEVPPEGLLTALVPIVGIFAGVALDGLEIFVLPIVFAMLLMPILAPRSLVQAAKAS